jgi:hypothetical protein
VSLRREFTTLLADRVAPWLAEQGLAPAPRGGFLRHSPTDDDAFIGVSPLISKRSTTTQLLYTFDVGLWFPRIAAVLGSPTGQADEPESWHAKCRSTDSPASQERGDFERASWYYFDGQSPQSEAEWDLARDDLNWALGQMLPLASESSIEAFWGSGSYNGQTDAEHQAYLRAVRRVLGH